MIDTKSATVAFAHQSFGINAWMGVEQAVAPQLSQTVMVVTGSRI
jgi:hypothetical protein